MVTTKTITGQSFVVIDPKQIVVMMNDGQSGVLRDLFNRGERVKQQAIRIAPVGTPDPLGRPRADGAAPGNLRNHIVKRLVRGKGGVPTMLVGVENVPYAIYVHEGARPHDIVPKTAPFLVFMGRDGTTVFTKVVHHPGNKPNRFLIRALSAAA